MEPSPSQNNRPVNDAPSTVAGRAPQSPTGVATRQDKLLSATRLIERVTPTISSEEIRENLRDKTWSSVVWGTRIVSYASTAIVAAVTLGQVAAIPAGYNPFEALHNHPLLSHVSTAAHLTVMFLAASAGFGLWRFRQTEDAISEKLDTMFNTFTAQKAARELLKARLSALQEHAVTHCKQDDAPQHPETVRESAARICRFLGELEAEPGSQVGQRMLAVPLAERIRELKALADDYATTLRDASPHNPPLPRLDLKSIEADLNSIGILHTKWTKLHDELSKLLPKINLPQAHQVAQQIQKQLIEVAQRPDSAKWHAITVQAIQMETSCSELKLPETTRALIAHVVEKLQRLPQDASPAEISALATRMSGAFERISKKIIESHPEANQYDLLRFQLHHRIRDFAHRYPNSSARASVAGLVAAVSYWISCEESLNALLPTTTDLYANSEVGLKFVKDIIPFVLQGSIAFAAGAVNSKFRPHIVWASLELSRLTFNCAAPFAWVYRKGQNGLDKIWGKLEDRAMGNIYRKR